MIKADELAAMARGEGCLAKSADDEPIFILCARDVFAADTVRVWADSVEGVAAMRGLDDGGLTAERKAKIAEARALAIQMERWRQAHGGGKIPD